MKKILSLLVLFLTVFSISTVKENEVTTVLRDVELLSAEIDYQSFFNEFENAELKYEKENNYISFSGIQSIDSSMLNDIDLVSVTTNGEDELDINYEFEYLGNENIFLLNITATNVDEGEILDQIVGVPFLTSNDEIDILFDIEGEQITLTELEETSLLENCGWFSRALKKVAKAAAAVAVVAAVVAVTAVAAPVVIAAATSTVVATSAGTTMLVAGTVATSTLAACTVSASAYLTAKIEDEADQNGNEDVSNNATSQNQMQKQVEKGQAPNEVDRVDKAHNSFGQEHVHLKDGTAINKDGTIHDKHKGIPNPSKKVLDWLNDNGWCLNGIKK